MKALALLLCFGTSLFATAATAALKPGDAAPDFTVQAALGGKEFKFALAKALKNGPVVVYFYPKSFTKICTEEAPYSPKTSGISRLQAPVSSACPLTQSIFSVSSPRKNAATNFLWAPIRTSRSSTPTMPSSRAGLWRTAFPTSSRLRERSSPLTRTGMRRNTSRLPWTPSGNGSGSTSAERQARGAASYQIRLSASAKAPSPQPSPARGEGVRLCPLSGQIPSPLAGEGGRKAAG